MAAARAAALQIRDTRDQLNVGVGKREEGIDIAPVERVIPQVVISTFSCDIAYSESPAASRASARSINELHQTACWSRKRRTV